MRLVDLGAEFMSFEADHSPDAELTVSTAAGVMFECPACGKHSVLVWFKGKVPDSASPGPGRWAPMGTGLADLSLTPSINLLTSECRWHGWVTNGDAV